MNNRFLWAMIALCSFVGHRNQNFNQMSKSNAGLSGWHNNTNVFLLSIACWTNKFIGIQFHYEKGRCYKDIRQQIVEEKLVPDSVD